MLAGPRRLRGERRERTPFRIAGGREQRLSGTAGHRCPGRCPAPRRPTTSHRTEHDSILQSREVLDLIQTPAVECPDAILFEPVGTALAQPARAAAAAGVGWVVLNREKVEYFADLRQKFRSPMFSVTTSHREVGQIQGQQIARLLPNGGAVLYIEGPSDNNASVRRTEGMQLAKPHNFEVRILRGRWTGESAYN